VTIASNEKRANCALLSLDRAEERNAWESLVRNSAWSDTYYRPAYAASYQSENQKLNALLLDSGERRFLLPFAFRPLSALPFAPDFSGFDISTPYGYGGLMPVEQGPISREEAAELVSRLQAWCKREGIVSCYVRLHPLFAQQEWFNGIQLDGVTLQDVGPTMSVELDEWDEEQGMPVTLPKGRRDKARWARRKLALELITCEKPGSAEALSQFVELYNGTMDRRQASNFYYFKDNYYHSLAQGLGADMAIVLARYEGRPVAAGIFFADAHYAHYHLSGSTDEGRKFHGPAVVVLKAAEWARSKGCQRLHLGGGLAPNDSLFQFKETFGGKTFEYCALKIVGDSTVYSDLVQQRLASDAGPIRENFFPGYRG
jgi:hypothetical protein